MLHGTRVAGFAVTVVKRIVDDLTDRRGLRQAWEEVDEDIQQEVVDKWRAIAIEEAEKWLKEKK